MFGARIALLRKSFGLSQQELANRLGVSASAVGMYEQGRREPPCALICELADLFGVSTDFLLTGQVRTHDEKALRTAHDTLHAQLSGKLVLRDEAGCERPFGEEDLAVLFAVLLG